MRKSNRFGYDNINKQSNYNMVDTIYASLKFNNTNTHLIKPLMDQMTGEHFDLKNNCKYYTGNIENMQVVVNEFGVTAKGSIAKLYQGNNVIALEPATIELATEKLCDLMHLPMDKAQVNRLDIAQNLSLSKPAAFYYSNFGERNYMKRLEKDQGLYYTNNLGVRAFYDKTAEVRKSKQRLPADIVSQNLFRFEVKDNGHKTICKRYNVPELSVGKLCEPSFYRGMVSHWAAEYVRIDKHEAPPLFDDEVYQNPKKLCAQIAYKGIEAYGGQNNLMTMIKQAKERGVFKTVQQYHALKRKLSSLGKIVDGRQPNELIAEVDGKVFDFCRLSI